MYINGEELFLQRQAHRVVGKLFGPPGPATYPTIHDDNHPTYQALSYRRMAMDKEHPCIGGESAMNTPVFPCFGREYTMNP